MANEDEVKRFLQNFHAKLSISNIIFRDDRGKNTQMLLTLEIMPGSRVEIIKKIKIEDYSEGPLPDVLNKQTDMWVFGKEEKEKEIYIKISLGYPGCSTICISFHIAEYKMNYPFKTKQK